MPLALSHLRAYFPAVLTACGAASLLALVDGADAQSGTTTRDGIFSAAQVERGRESFLWECMDCHEMEEFTGVGAYLEEMDGEPVWEVFEFIWSEMPEDRPAWLEPEQYADILAYILSVYGAPTGDRDMPIDREPLIAIQIRRPELPGS